MIVRAKFRVENVREEKDHEGISGFTVNLYPVVGGSRENEEFYRLTPSGNIVLSTINEKAGKSFIEGKEFYVDFTPVD